MQVVEQHITITLQSMEELFHPPNFDPFGGQVENRSGFDRIFAELQPRPLIRPLRTTIRLPEHQMTPDLENRCRIAIEKLCDNRIEQKELRRASQSRSGMIALQFGLIFLAVCLLLSGLFDAMNLLPEFPRYFLSEGFVIVGWVVLWHPVEILIFDRRELSRDRRILECMRSMKIEIEPVLTS